MSSDFISEANMIFYESKLEDILLDETINLTNWEIDFLDSLVDFDGCFSTLQANKLDEMHTRFCS